MGRQLSQLYSKTPVKRATVGGFKHSRGSGGFARLIRAGKKCSLENKFSRFLFLLGSFKGISESNKTHSIFPGIAGIISQLNSRRIVVIGIS